MQEDEELHDVSLPGDIPQADGEAYPVSELKDVISKLDNAVVSASVPLIQLGTCSIDCLPKYQPPAHFQDIDGTEQCHSEPISPNNNQDDDTSTDIYVEIPKLLDFQFDIQDRFPKMYEEEGEANQIILTNITTNVYGTITIEALETLGKQRVKSSAHRDLTTNMYWADVYKPSHEMLFRIEKSFGIHPLTSEDILVSSTREKFEEYPRYIYIVFSERQFVPNSNNVRTANVNLLLFHNFVISFHNCPINTFAVVLHSIVFRVDEIKYSEWVAYKFMDAIVDELMVAVTAVQTDVRQIDGFVLQMVGSNSQEDFILRISVARQQIAELSDLLSHKRDILVLLSAEKQLVLAPHIKLYLRDILDHVVLMLQQLHHSEDVLNNVNSTYLALISIKMAEGSNQMNQVMKRFSAVATIVIPLTLISSLWGMNVEVPGQTWGLGLLWFFVILIGMCLWLCIALVLFKVKRWF